MRVILVPSDGDLYDTVLVALSDSRPVDSLERIWLIDKQYLLELIRGLVL